MTGPTVRWDYSILSAQVEQHSYVNMNECWIWTYGVWSKGVIPNRYPRITIAGLQRNVVRHLLYAVTQYWGEEACHNCDVIACVNPDHVRWGTKLDNVNDQLARGNFVTPPAGDTHWTRRLGDQARQERSNQQRKYWSDPEVKKAHSALMKEVKTMKNM